MKAYKDHFTPAMPNREFLVEPIELLIIESYRGNRNLPHVTIAYLWAEHVNRSSSDITLESTQVVNTILKNKFGVKI